MKTIAGVLLYVQCVSSEWEIKYETIIYCNVSLYKRFDICQISEY